MTSPNFSKQKQLANKKASDLEDHEKIYLLKREIDNLRTQIKDSNGPLNTNASQMNAPSQNSGMCTSGLCRIPLLSMFLVVGVLMVAVWRKRRSIYYRYSRTSSSFLSDNEQVATPATTTLQFELQDAHDYAPPTAQSEGTIHFL